MSGANITGPISPLTAAHRRGGLNIRQPYHAGFAVLVFPALLALDVLLTAMRLYPRLRGRS